MRNQWLRQPSGVGWDRPRGHLVEKFERLVEEYNLGTLDAQAFFEALKKLVAEMDEEERRAAREGLTQDELAIFDLLTKAQEAEVKKVARELLEKLRDLLAVDNWQLRVQPRDTVYSDIRFTLDRLPQEPYPELMWKEKVEAVWQFVFTRYQGNDGGGAVSARRDA